jgi:hypothetical protein
MINDEKRGWSTRNKRVTKDIRGKLEELFKDKPADMVREEDNDNNKSNSSDIFNIRRNIKSPNENRE